MRYTTDMLDKVVNTLAAVAGQAVLAIGEAKDRATHASGVKGAARDISAQAVSMAFLMSMGRKVFAKRYAHKLPDTARKAVNISQIWGILDKWSEPVELASQWAKGDFSKTPVADAVKFLRPAPDYTEQAINAIREALDAGVSSKALRQAVTGAIDIAEAVRAALELEILLAEEQEAANVQELETGATV